MGKKGLDFFRSVGIRIENARNLDDGNLNLGEYLSLAAALTPLRGIGSSSL